MYLEIHNKDELLLFTENLQTISPQWIAIDTEFHRESTYFPILSLIQIATESQTWVIDAISCHDVTPLKIILENKKIKKIFHAGDQDWDILRQSTGAITWPFSDTQLMATFATMGHSCSLETLAFQLLKISVDKSQQSTNWLQRPLKKIQLEYAAADATYVAKIYPILCQKLVELGRDDWVDQEMKRFLQKYKQKQSKDWLKLCFIGCKWPVPFYALELAKWRDKWAKKLNIPRRYVIADILLDKALRTKSIDHITKDNCKEAAHKDLVRTWKKLTFMWDKQSPEYVQKLCQMVSNHLQIFTPTQKILLKKWRTKVKLVAEMLSISPHYVLNKQQLLQMVTGEKKRLFSGWRKDAFKKLAKRD